MHDKRHHSEDFQLLPLTEMDGPICRVAREQRHGWRKLQLLHRELAIHRGDHHAAMPGLAAAVDYQQVAIADPVVDHAVTGRPHEVGGRRVGNTQLIEIDGLLGVVLRRRRKATGHRGENRGSSNKGASGVG